MNISEIENQSSTSNVMVPTQSCIWKKHTIMALQVSLLSFFVNEIINFKYFADGPGHYSEYLQSIGQNPCICIPGFHRHPDGRCIWFHDNNYCKTIHAETQAVTTVPPPVCKEGKSYFILLMRKKNFMI